MQIYKWEGNGRFSLVEQNKKIENLALRIIKFLASMIVAVPAFFTFHVLKWIARDDDALVEKYRRLDHFLIKKQNNNQKTPEPRAENAISSLPTELKLNIFSFLDIPDLVRFSGVNREFQQLMKKDHAHCVGAYQINIKGLEPSEKNSSFCALIEKVKHHTDKYHLKPELINFFGSLKRILEYPVIIPERLHKNLYSWIKAQSKEDWKQKPNILRVQGQHFDTHRVTESIVMKYSLFLPQEVQQAANAVEQVWHGYLYTQSTLGTLSIFLDSDIDIQNHVFEDLLKEDFKKTDANFENPLDLTAPIFCDTLPRLDLLYRNYKNKWDEVRKIRRRFQDFMEGKQISFYENLPYEFKKAYPYLNNVVVVLGWKNLQEITAV